MTKWKYVLAIASCLLASCQMSASEQSATPNNPAMSQHSSTTNSKLSVVTTFYPVYYMAKTITGDVANVSMLIDGTIDSHDYEPSAKDIATINESSVFIYSNAHMETWVPRLIDSLGNQRKTAVVETGKSLTLSTNQENTADTEHPDIDPHIWLDPVLAQEQVQTIAAELIAKDPKNKNIYTKNKDALITKLAHLAQQYETTLSTATNKTFITQHAAFGYIAKRYGLKQISITGLQATEPTPKDVTEVIEKINEQHLHVIYVDPTGSSKTAQTVSEATGAKILPLYTIEQAVNGKDYLQLLESNLESLKQSLK